MAILNASLTIDDPQLIEAYRQMLLDANPIVRESVNATANRMRDRILAEFKREPGHVVYSHDGHLAWTSDKQRKAYFASDGFGNGIGYKRRSAPNRMVDQWKLIVIYEANAITSVGLQNNDPTHEFVTGDRQQEFHRLTGWYDENVLITRAQQTFADEVETDLLKALYSVDSR